MGLTKSRKSRLAGAGYIFLDKFASLLEFYVMHQPCFVKHNVKPPDWVIEEKDKFNAFALPCHRVKSETKLTIDTLIEWVELLEESMLHGGWGCDPKRKEMKVCAAFAHANNTLSLSHTFRCSFLR